MIESSLPLDFDSSENDVISCEPSRNWLLSSDFVSAFTLEAGLSCETNMTSSTDQHVHFIVVNLPQSRAGDDGNDDASNNDNIRSKSNPNGDKDYYNKERSARRRAGRKKLSRPTVDLELLSHSDKKSESKFSLCFYIFIYL